MPPPDATRTADRDYAVGAAGELFGFTIAHFSSAAGQRAFEPRDGESNLSPIGSLSLDAFSEGRRSVSTGSFEDHRAGSD
jgi:hypothetical protein